MAGVETLNAGVPWTCQCGATFRLWAFPAALRAVECKREAAQVMGDEASCYYHANNQAVAHCDRCGRFICTTCDVGIGAARYCPPCVEKGAAAKSIPLLTGKYSTQDALALSIALAPVVAFIVAALIAFPASGFDAEVLGVVAFMALGALGLFSGPVAILFGIQALRSVQNFPVPRGRWRAVTAVGVGALSLAILVAVFAIAMYSVVVEVV